MHRSKPVYTLIILTLVSAQLLLPAVISYNIFKIKRLREQAVTKYKGEFSRIIISTEEFTCCNFQNKNEIEWNGIMYDVVSVKNENGCYILDVLADNTETGLQHINTKFAGAASDGKAAPPGYFFSFLYFEKQDNAEAAVYYSEAVHHFPYIIPVYITPYLKILKPPPDRSLLLYT